MDFRAYILNNLLDKYEASKHYQGKAVVNRKVKMSFTRKNFPQYWEGDKPHLKAAIHQVVEELARKGLITKTWLPFEKGNILDFVSLNLENLDLAYALARRTPKKDEVRQLIQEITLLQEKIKINWILQFLGDCLSLLQEEKNIPTFLPKEQTERDLLFKAFWGLQDKGKEQILERVFSLKYLGNSKVFQQKIRKRLAHLALKYLALDPDLSDDDIMGELGIIKTTEEILIYGSIIFEYQGQKIDYTPFPFGGIIDTGFLDNMKLAGANIKQVITIENKANFHYLVAQGVPTTILLLYLGGFPGPRKRELLAKIFNYDQKNNLGIAYYHWGDIDVGGFRIFGVIEKVLPSLQPLFMDEETLIKYQDYCDQIEESYAKQIIKMLEKEEYRRFAHTLEVMLKERIRLEQEALLTDHGLNELLQGVYKVKV